MLKSLQFWKYSTKLLITCIRTLPLLNEPNLKRKWISYRCHVQKVCAQVMLAIVIFGAIQVGTSWNCWFGYAEMPDTHIETIGSTETRSRKTRQPRQILFLFSLYFNPYTLITSAMHAYTRTPLYDNAYTKKHRKEQKKRTLNIFVEIEQAKTNGVVEAECILHR